MDTVHQAVSNGTPVLLVKGSGYAACLMSDTVLLTKAKNEQHQKDMSDVKQQQLREFLDDFFEGLEELQKTRDGSLNWRSPLGRVDVIRILRKNVKLLQDEYDRITDPNKSGFQTPRKKQVTDWTSFRVSCGREIVSVKCVCGMREIVPLLLG